VPVSRLDPSAGLDDVLLLAATETTSAADIDSLVVALSRRTCG
jgi:glycine dehydrogenase subunit 1